MRLSIVIVVLNAAEALRTTLASIDSQKDANPNIVVVDGLSSDHTVKVIEEYAALIGTWISEPDDGLYDAMNKGKTLADGDHVLFMNAGDVFASRDTLGTVASFIECSNKLYFGNVILERGELRWRTPAPRVTDVRQSAILPHHQSVFYPRIFFSSNDFDTSYRIIADVAFTFSALQSVRPQHIDVDVIISSLEGVGISFYSSVSKTIAFASENLRFYRDRRRVLGWAPFLTALPKTAAKFLLWRIGGLDLLAWSMRRAAERRAN